jgi:hypothetical protein
MTAFSLKAIVAQSLAEIGMPDVDIAPPRERSRTTRWLPHAHGIGIRSYPSGRSVYVAEARMGGRQRTLTIGSAAGHDRGPQRSAGDRRCPPLPRPRSARRQPSRYPATRPCGADLCRVPRRILEQSCRALEAIDP